MSSMSVFCLVENNVCFELFFGTVGYLWGIFIVKFYFVVARRGAHLAAERSPSAARADGARRSVAVPNGEGVASGSATLNF